MANEVHEFCSVVGVITPELSDPTAAVKIGVDALLKTDHRGSKSGSGIAVDNGNEISVYKKVGRATTVFSENVSLDHFEGSIVTGHNRWGTDGGEGQHLLPYTRQDLGFSGALNGNSPDLETLICELEESEVATSRLNDAEIVLSSIAMKIGRGEDLTAAITKTYPDISGGFAYVVSHDNRLAGFVDPNGVRPLVVGGLKGGGYMFASETCALGDAEYLFNVQPGELVLASASRLDRIKLADEPKKFDLMELLYFSDPMSKYNDRNIYGIRMDIGTSMASEHPPEDDDLSQCIVVPVPESGRPYAIGYSRATGMSYSEAIMKNRTAARTFTLATDTERHAAAGNKYSYNEEEIRGKKVYICDDSIFRLTTARHIVRNLYSCGAQEVHFMSAAPPVIAADYQGMDIASQHELAAANMTPEQIRSELQCTSLGYTSLMGISTALNESIDNFNIASFTGTYPRDIGAKKRALWYPPATQPLYEPLPKKQTRSL